MSTFVFKSNTLNYTPINNIFIDKYMANARGEFIKVYILGLKYVLSGEPGVNTSIMASKLHILESDVVNAWSYWNDEGVVKMHSVDNMGNYSIEFVDLSSSDVKEDNVNLLEELNTNSTKDMLQDIEKLLARPLSSKEMSMYISWLKDLSFSHEIILLLIQYCASKGKADTRYMEKMAISWHDNNIRNVDDAQSFIKKHEDKWIKIKQVLNYLGIKDGEVMKPQEEMLVKWTDTFGFSMDMIHRACDICFQRLNKADFRYIDGILNSWYKGGLKTIEDIDIKDSKRLPYKKNTPAKKPGDNFNNYEQRTYDFDDLERKLLGWDNND